MSPLATVVAAAVVGTPLAALWGAASLVLARRHTVRLARYDDALLAVANEGRDQ